MIRYVCIQCFMKAGIARIFVYIVHVILDRFEFSIILLAGFIKDFLLAGRKLKDELLDLLKLHELLFGLAASLLRLGKSSLDVFSDHFGFFQLLKKRQR